MDIDDISPEFKVQWLNIMLKFIKNDKELTYRSPEWPISRVKLYHALISQRQRDIGLGFKSLYAPLWEAMQIFSLKYTYRVSIINAKDEEKGFLVIEKVPIKPEEKDDTDSEDDTCQHQLTKKTEQIYIQNRNIIEKISPTFLKTTLQTLLNFVKDEASASIDFKSLAPIEVKFIENVQTIHNHKHLFYKILSPACIDILKKITLNLSLCNNTFKMKVCNVKINPKTAKRDLTVVKEPNYDNPATKKRSKSKKSSTIPLESPKCINSLATPSKLETKSACNKVTKLSQIDIKAIKDTQITSEVKNDAKSKENVSTTTNNRTVSSCNKNNKLLQIDVKVTTDKQITSEVKNEAKSKENVYTTTAKGNESSCNKDSKLSPINVKVIADKQIKSEVKNNAKSKENVSTTTSEKNRITSMGISKKSTNTIRESPNHSVKGKVSGKDQKKLIIEAMSKPLESDKGLRMMQLMGWEGGALGLRGDGITEPIMPSLHLKPGAGLGHIKKGGATSSVKPKVENKKIDKRVQFLEGVLEVLVKGMKMIHFDTSLSEKELRFFSNALTDFNRRLNIDLPSGKKRKLAEEIMNKLIKEPEKIIDFCFLNDDSDLCLQLIIKKKAQTSPSPQNSMDMAEFQNILKEIMFQIAPDNVDKKQPLEDIALKIFVLDTMLDFVNSDDTRMELDFSFGYSNKIFKYMKSVCQAVNTKTPIGKKSTTEREMVERLGMDLNGTLLSVGECNQILTVRKSSDLFQETPSKKQIVANNFVKVRQKDEDGLNDVSDSDFDKENLELKNNASKNTHGVKLNADTNNKLLSIGGVNKAKEDGTIGKGNETEE